MPANPLSFHMLPVAIAFLFLATNLDLAMSANFTELLQFSWAPDHIVSEEDKTKLTLDNVSGCGFQSKKNYLFGQAIVQIKLIEGNFAGTVTAFYMASEGPTHDELDLDFLSNVSGEPYLVQTNIYVYGTGNRDQRFLVDGIPIRIFTNKEDEGMLFPENQPISIRGSVWNADDWGTQGGRVKIYWSHAPFVSAFQSFVIDACELSPETEDILAKCGKSGQLWWDKPSFSVLNRHRRHQLKWVRRRHLVDDYCKDTARFTELPRECIS